MMIVLWFNLRPQRIECKHAKTANDPLARFWQARLRLKLVRQVGTSLTVTLLPPSRGTMLSLGSQSIWRQEHQLTLNGQRSNLTVAYAPTNTGQYSGLSSKAVKLLLSLTVLGSDSSPRQDIVLPNTQLVPRDILMVGRAYFMLYFDAGCITLS